ncbi:hypothetical protein, partial [Xanthomonas oryzae]|uniref:hypothetical protein n=1 Tax=Xanthomonas oryzae TaxID=347 RepID=UPI003CCE7796
CCRTNTPRPAVRGWRRSSRNTPAAMRSPNRAWTRCARTGLPPPTRARGTGCPRRCCRCTSGRRGRAG